MLYNPQIDIMANLQQRFKAAGARLPSRGYRLKGQPGGEESDRLQGLMDSYKGGMGFRNRTRNRTGAGSPTSDTIGTIAPPQPLHEIGGPGAGIGTPGSEYIPERLGAKTPPRRRLGPPRA